MGAEDLVGVNSLAHYSALPVTPRRALFTARAVSSPDVSYLGYRHTSLHTDLFIPESIVGLLWIVNQSPDKGLDHAPISRDRLPHCVDTELLGTHPVREDFRGLPYSDGNF
ncbi:uncharacterized protein N7483_012504 [Penicillium malachiteum]|uniref:uncharacterized protein n=1 Tax=Penicillium malachiteum TaxID=1324776 RepID=UPI00254907C8|nr:uncharacterized protein N7483_012504 [Penicillium malachiteum]KAJ5715323.1 hypothetical protein N7483_012504 [Penicillium malachiteum]